MSKKETNAAQTTNPNLDELLSTGTTTITADSREAVYEMSAQLVGLISAGVDWTRGAVQHRKGVFTQIYTLTKKEEN